MREIPKINNDIRLAETLPGWFYTDAEVYNHCLTAVFNKSVLYVDEIAEKMKMPENTFPISWYPNALNEEILLIKTESGWRVSSNICTHRGFKIVHHPTKLKKLQCGYHGRRWNMDGQFEFMPEFKEAEQFPSPCDHLPTIEFVIWKRFLFAGLSPKIDMNLYAKILEERVGFLSIEQWDLASDYSKTYSIKANWALYCDNYLEGFHIPFVHESLGQIVDYGSYTTEIYDHAVLQVGYAKDGAACFNFPEGHVDYGKNISAYYYWLFPNFMLNFYTWGVQINIVKPLAIDRCKVEFIYFIGDHDAWESFGKDQIAEKTEREDEFVVEAVQKGLKSSLYKSGRFSPKREKGVHYFHRLLSEYCRSSNA